MRDRGWPPSGTLVSPTHCLLKLYRCPWPCSVCAQPAVEGRGVDHPLLAGGPGISRPQGERSNPGLTVQGPCPCVIQGAAWSVSGLRVCLCW